MDVAGSGPDWHRDCDVPGATPVCPGQRDVAVSRFVAAPPPGPTSYSVGQVGAAEFSPAVVSELFGRNLNQDVPQDSPQGLPGAWRSDETPAELVRFAALSTTDRAQAFLAHLGRRYPGRIELHALGTSVAGRPILAMRLPPVDEGGGGGPAPVGEVHEQGDKPGGAHAGQPTELD